MQKGYDLNATMDTCTKNKYTSFSSSKVYARTPKVCEILTLNYSLLRRNRVCKHLGNEDGGLLLSILRPAQSPWRLQSPTKPRNRTSRRSPAHVTSPLVIWRTCILELQQWWPRINTRYMYVFKNCVSLFRYNEMVV